LPLRFVTLTGADESVDPRELLAAFPEPGRVELGILWAGPHREGQPRYPGLRWLRQLALAAPRARNSPQLALHLCGNAEKSLADWPAPSPVDPAAVLEALGLPDAGIFRRIQMNRALGSNLRGRESFDAGRMSAMGRLLAKRLGGGFVLQARHPTPAVMDHAAEVLEGGAHGVAGVLVDASGGRGITPGSWPAAEPSRFVVGWAGGLGPDNLRAELPAIQGAAGDGRSFWVDMETKLRTGPNGEAFSIEACREAVAEARAWSVETAAGRAA
jgi:hypothetical protein